MTRQELSWIELSLLQPQRCRDLAWFLYGCVERENVLNLDACLIWWAHSFRFAAGEYPVQASARRNLLVSGGAMETGEERTQLVPAKR